MNASTAVLRIGAGLLGMMGVLLVVAGLAMAAALAGALACSCAPGLQLPGNATAWNVVEVIMGGLVLIAGFYARPAALLTAYQDVMAGL